MKLQHSTRHPSTTQQRLHLARVHNVEGHHNAQHQNGVKSIQKPFVAKYVAAISLDELDDADHRSDKDEDARSVERKEVLAPRDEL